MHYDAVAIGHLAFLRELASSNGFPGGTLVRALENSQHAICGVGCDRVHRIRLGRSKREARARHPRWSGQSLSQLLPALAAILRTPDAILRSTLIDGREDYSLGGGVEDHRITPIVIGRYKALPRPRLSAIRRREHSGGVTGIVRYAAKNQMHRIERVDGDHTDAPRNPGGTGRSKLAPGLPAILGAEDTHASIRIGRAVGFARAAINRIGRFRIDRQRADIQHGLVVPLRSPCLASVIASPHTATRRTDIHNVRIRGVHGKSGASASNIRRACGNPVYSRRSGRVHAIAFGNQSLNIGFADRVRSARLEPGGSDLVRGVPWRRRAFHHLLQRAGVDLHRGGIAACGKLLPGSAHNALLLHHPAYDMTANHRCQIKESKKRIKKSWPFPNRRDKVRREAAWISFNGGLTSRPMAVAADWKSPRSSWH